MKFQKGEIAIMQNANKYPEFEGLECTVEEIFYIDIRGLGYLISIPGHKPPFNDYWFAYPYQLRKKHPPQEFCDKEIIKKIFAPNREEVEA